MRRMGRINLRRMRAAGRWNISPRKARGNDEQDFMLILNDVSQVIYDSSMQGCLLYDHVNH